MADNLETYFKKHLSDENISEGQWNTPSDKVWEKALPEIRKKKGLFIPWRYIYIATALLFVGLAITLGIVYIPGSSEVKDEQAGIQAATENKITEVEEETEIPETAGEMKPKENLKSSEDVVADETGAEVLLSERKIHAEENKTVSTHSKEVITPTEQEILTPEPMALSDGPIERILDTRHVIARADQIHPALVIHSQTIRPRQIMQSEVQMPAYTFEAAPTFAKRAKSFGLGIYYAPTYNNTAVKGETTGGELETGNHYLYSGNYGLVAKYYFSDRLAFISGLGSLKVKSWSKAITDFSYDGSNEHVMPDGEIENMSELPMATPFGEIGTEITYRFPGDEIIPDGEPMEAELETHQEISYFSVPLGVEYDLLPLNRLQWYGEGGVRLNWASGDATEFNSRILHYGQDMNVVKEEMMSHPDFSDFFLDFYIGTGLSYPLSKYLLLQGSLRYSRNITKVNVQDGLSTRVQAMGMKIGLIYFF